MKTDENIAYITEKYYEEAKDCYEHGDMIKFFNNMTRYYYHRSTIRDAMIKKNLPIPSGEMLMSYERMRIEHNGI